LDNVDTDQHEKLLKELHGTGLFAKVIAITANRGASPSKMVATESLGFDFQSLYVWTVSRNDIRIVAQDMLDTVDPVSISSFVDKVYDDLLKLCIPLTPANVIMYLRVLQREGEYHPLNRVDILGRYLEEALRRPSDAYADSFNFKNKIDLIAKFVSELNKEKKGHFDIETWNGFIKDYSSGKLLTIDSDGLLQELLDARIFGSWSGKFFLKYRFFYSYFLGRYLVSHPAELEKFLNTKEYMELPSIVDVITGLSSNNEVILNTITNELQSLLKVFHSDFINNDFDPLLELGWSDKTDDEKELWEKINSDIAAGPKKAKQIDDIKTCLLSEAATADQETKFLKFMKLENLIFLVANLLGDALKNSEDVDGALKVEAYQSLLFVDLIVLQIGTSLAPVIGSNPVIGWGGLLFVGFDEIKTLESGEPDVLSVVLSISNAINCRTAREIGTKKLSGVFHHFSQSGKASGFQILLNFSHILAAKGKGWELALEKLIVETDKNSFYLNAMLSRLWGDLKNELNTGKNRKRAKRLVAVVQAKRTAKTNAPGAKLVSSTLKQMEKQGHFLSGDT